MRLPAFDGLGRLESFVAMSPVSEVRRLAHRTRVNHTAEGPKCVVSSDRLPFPRLADEQHGVAPDGPFCPRTRASDTGVAADPAFVVAFSNSLHRPRLTRERRVDVSGQE